MEEKLELYQSGSGSDKIVMVSNSLAFEPSLGLNYRLPGKLSIDVNMGYMKYINSKLHVKGEKDAVLILKNYKTVLFDWSGLRLTAGIFYQFF